MIPGAVSDSERIGAVLRWLYRGPAERGSAWQLGGSNRYTGMTGRGMTADRANLALAYLGYPYLDRPTYICVCACACVRVCVCARIYARR